MDISPSIENSNLFINLKTGKSAFLPVYKFVKNPETVVNYDVCPECGDEIKEFTRKAKNTNNLIQRYICSCACVVFVNEI